jgi:hypothetical protein
MPTTERTVGARSVTGKRKHGLGWLPWVALLLIALLVAAVLLVVANVSDENDEPGIDVTDDEVVEDGAPAPDLLVIL